MAAPDDGTIAAYNHCTDEWIRAYNQGPFTSFKMVEVILGVLKLEARDILRDPTQLSVFQGRRVNEEKLWTTYLDTWAKSTGRCTSFAIRVAEELRTQYPDDGFHFEFFNLGRHRVARCRRYGFVIDSESPKGIDILRDHQDWISTPDQERGRWRFYENHSVFEARTNPRDRYDVHPIPAAAALGICLEEVANHGVLVCVFRQSFVSTEDQTPQVEYHGSIRWRLSKRRMELAPHLKYPDRIATITFGDGNKETNRECVANLRAFILDCGFDYQWKADAIDIFNRQLWKAAVLEWGYPVWKAYAHP
ncbi:hypothetical protein QBC37DRAFT_398710 [Rhypophila decipiens]|uniref:Uncharacterized protein n=1 Tax=Rhypophila decipiens TaxID=261697 RepID=A0AAN7BC08_9PEZI|nr:hypothetical protein QBC37DRAFT_398710 [Rhypophila decipiens]